MKKETSVTILLSRRERDLIAKYGYPFEEIEKQIKAAGDEDLLAIADSPFWWERVIVNLHISEEEPDKCDAAPEMRALINRIAEELKLNPTN